MRLNYIGGSSSTGGTGTLTLSAAGGLALPSKALIADQSVEYSIVEYTDSTLATISKTESGFGTISSGDVLTRTAPRTKWDGTTYTQTSVSALSFGTSNVRVYVSALAEGGPTSAPVRPDKNVLNGYGAQSYVIGANLVFSTDFPTAAMTLNEQRMVPLRLECGYPISEIGVKVTTAVASATVHVALASMNPSTGAPGRILAVANSLDAGSTGVKLGSITSKLFPPGWYWSLFSVSSASVVLTGCEVFSAGPLGHTDTRTIRGLQRTRTHATYTVGDDATTGTSGSWSLVTNVAYPVLFMR